MQSLKNKTIAILISLLMIVSIGATIAHSPGVHGAISIPTFAYINVAPNPCGINQAVTVDFWLAVPLQSSELAVNMYIHITLPDGTNATQGPYTSDVTGGTTISYTPTQTGNYTFQFSYGGQNLTVGAFAGDSEEQSTSQAVTLVVQSTPAANYPFTPLPTTYWQTPVNAENVQNWYAITGPWLGLATNNFGVTGVYNITGNYNPYTAGPTTAHILWTTPWCVGGVVGGDAGGSEQAGNYWTTSQYEPKWNPVVIDGIEYSTWYTTSTGTGSNEGIVAKSLYSGQTMWIINTTNALRCGWAPVWQTNDQYGAVGPFIWTTGSLPAGDTGGSVYPTIAGSTQYNMYDGLTGDYVCSIVNGTSVQMTVDSQGDLIGYYFNATVGTEIIHPNPATSTLITEIAGENELLCAVNFTMCLGQNTGEFSLVKNSQNRFELGIIYANPSIPNNITGAAISPALAGDGYLSATNAQMITCASGVIMLTSGMDNSYAPSAGETAGFLIEAGFNQATGALLWIDNRTETPWTRLCGYTAAAGVYIDINQATYVMNAYSLYTGNLVWTKTLTTTNGEPLNNYDEYDFLTLPDASTGIDFCWALGGDIWAINMTSGNIIWWTDTTILTGSSGTETPYGIWPLWTQYGGVAAGQNGLLYLSEGHEYSPPLFHGAQQLCLNMTNGQLVWSILAFDDTAGAITDNILTTFNSYDGQIYAYGQGPSATTVTARNPDGTVGSPMVISGTVMDVSAGTQQQAVAANFPDGLPCVSDASESHWMEYVYEQQPEPTNVTGVTVDLTSIDPNGNTVPMGTATSDANGFYTFTYMPPISGNYTVIATFPGTGSYYGSHAETSFYASSAPTTPAPTASPAKSVADTYFVPAIAGLFVLIIIVLALVVVLMLRKRP